MKSDRYALFALVGFSLFVSSMQFAMIAVALPDVLDDLNTSLRWLSWVITGFTLAQAVAMPIAGKLSDELGRRNVFVGGLVLFALASLACTVAPNVYVLIIARIFQGLAGGSLLPSAYGILADKFEGADRARVVGLISAIFPLGAIIGPNLGGIVVDNFGWRWTFAFNVPSSLLVVLPALWLMPKDEVRSAGKIDFLGAGLLTLSAASLVYGLTELSQRDANPSSAILVISFVLAVAALVAFIRRESTISFPVIELNLLKQKEFAFVNALNFFYGVTVFGMFAFIPLYAQLGYGMSSGETGALITPRSVAMSAVSTVASMLLPRTGNRKPIIAGLVVIVIGLVLLSLGMKEPTIGGVQFSNFFLLAFIITVMGCGIGLAGPASNNAAIELAPERIAAITGMRGMFRFLGGVIGTAVITLITTRADSLEEGLELSFLGLALVTGLTSFLVLGVPDGLHRPRDVPQPEPSRAVVDTPT